MKHEKGGGVRPGDPPFSALGRAVWDETSLDPTSSPGVVRFQCSRSSRMG